MCTNTELQEQIEVIHLKTDQNCKDISEINITHGAKLDAITQQLLEWTPYIQQSQKEIKRADAYKLVADDLRSKGAGWKFWLTLGVSLLTLVSLLLIIFERFLKVK